MKRYLQGHIYFFFLLLSFSLAMPLSAAPVLHIPEKLYTFDPVPEGMGIAHRFTVYNTGDEELRILRVTPG